MPDSASRWESYLFGIMSICLLIFQTKLMNQVMEIYPAAESLPIYNAFVILCNLICGAIILNEQAMYTTGELMVQCGLCSVVLAGIYVLLRKCYCCQP